MRKIILCCCLLLFISTQVCAADNGRDPSVIGTWTAIDTKKISGGFIFNKNGTVILIREDQHMDFSKEGGSATWRTDTSKTPKHLDVLLSYSDGKSTTLPMIYKLLQKDQLLVRQPESKDRPKEFLELSDKTQIVLYRKD